MRFIFAAAVSVALSGCSSMLYYPTKNIYISSNEIHKNHADVEFESASGNKLRGLLICAKECKGDRPLVIQFHGNGQNMTAHLLSLYWLTDRGYDLFTFDYAGYGSSDGKPSPEETVADGRAALDWASKRFPGRKLIVYGQSLGGAIGMRVVIENKNAFPIAMVVAESTFDSYESIAADTLSRSFVTWAFQPLAYLLMSDRFAPGDRIREIAPLPLIVIHSHHDSLVPYRFGERIFARAGEPKLLVPYAQPGHVISSLVDYGRIREILIKEFDRL